LERTIASEIVNHEVNIENEVNKKLNAIIEQHIQAIQKQKRIVAKCHQDNEAAKQKHQVRIFIKKILLSIFILLRFLTLKFLGWLNMKRNTQKIVYCC
jgi:glucose-6-phosphate-specific signal transduction histidine kinase